MRHRAAGRRTGNAVLIWGLVAAIGAGCAGLTPKDNAGPGVTVESSTPAGVATAGVPAVTPTPTPTPTHHATPKPTTTPTRTKPPIPVITCAGYTGKNLPKSTIKKYLTNAAAQDEYAALDPARLPDELNGQRPKVVIPLTLLKAIAAQESGWQSACQANDGMGFGTMQIQPEVPDGINAYFAESWDRMDPQENIRIAAALLQQNTVYFGIKYFHKTFDLAHNSALLNVVIASYNVGRGNVESNDMIHIGPVGTTYYKAVREQMLPTADCQHWG
jgi:hypothetical protein